GETWTRHRRIMQPAFAADHLDTIARPVLKATLQMLDGWAAVAAAGGTLDVAEELRRLTLKIAALTLLGTDLSEEVCATLVTGITKGTEYFAYRTRAPLAVPLFVPTPYNRSLKRLRKSVYDLLDQMIRQRRLLHRQGDKETGDADLLLMLVQARDSETGAGLSDEEIRYEAIGVLTAGSETTANGLAWTLALLAGHPEAEDKLLDELGRVLNCRLPTVADLPFLTYTRIVLDESMRLYPPTWVIGRTSVKEDH